MTSFWPNLCRFVDAIEGLTGIVLNIIVVIALWRKNLASNLITYRVSITIASIQGAFYSAIMALSGGVVHMCKEDRFISVFYGPVTLLPSSFDDALAPFSIFLAFTVWSLVPPACILQYLALCRPHLSNEKRLLLAYLPCIVLLVWSIPVCPSFLAGPQLHSKVIADVKEIHRLQDDDQFIVYGVTLWGTPENSYSMVKLMAAGVLPTYSIAYILFIASTIAVRRKLNHFGIKLSAKTALMQRRFLTTLVLQGCLPLAILTIPLTILGVGMLSGLDIAQFTVLLSFSFYLVPIVQAFVSLSFVLRGLKSPTSSQSMQSRTQMSRSSRETPRNSVVEG